MQDYKQSQLYMLCDMYVCVSVSVSVCVCVCMCCVCVYVCVAQQGDIIEDCKQEKKEATICISPQKFHQVLLIAIQSFFLFL